jgi:hypothetical protein
MQARLIPKAGVSLGFLYSYPLFLYGFGHFILVKNK